MRPTPRLLVVLAALVLTSCPPPEEDPTPDPRFTDEECSPVGETRCFEATTWQSCTDNLWYTEEVCTAAEVCSIDLGCVACDPFIGRVCDGDQVRPCQTDGSLGPILETCVPGTCVLGHCEEEECPEGTDLIYVIDTSYRLYRFDPRDEAFTFELLGSLNCPASPTLPGWGMSTTATPFSMSVDRSGVAWVLYTSGEIFHVPLNNLDNCTLSQYEVGSDGFELFGMGFVSDEAGSDQETLFVAGGTVEQMQAHATGRLASIEPTTVILGPIGYLTPSEFGPELTGTGAAELFAYFPGEIASIVARLDKTTGLNAETWSVGSLDGPLRAWAFAHWAGQFFIFVTYQDPLDGQVSQVHRLDRESGVTDIVLDGISYVIVGAGVSTCAPVVLE